MGNIRMSIDLDDREFSEALAKAVMLCGGFDVNVGRVRDTDHVLLSRAGSIAPSGTLAVEAGEFCEDSLAEEPYRVDIFAGADRVVSRIKFILGADQKASVSSRGTEDSVPEFGAEERRSEGFPEMRGRRREELVQDGVLHGRGQDARGGAADDV